MCKVLNISRSHYYNFKEKIEYKYHLANEVLNIFRDNKKRMELVELKPD